MNKMANNLTFFFDILVPMVIRKMYRIKKKLKNYSKHKVKIKKLKKLLKKQQALKIFGKYFEYYQGMCSADLYAALVHPVLWRTHVR